MAEVVAEKPAEVVPTTSAVTTANGESSTTKDAGDVSMTDADLVEQMKKAMKQGERPCFFATIC